VPHEDCEVVILLVAYKDRLLLHWNSMIGTKIYQKKTQAYFFLAMYGIMSVLGSVLIALAVMRNQAASV